MHRVPAALLIVVSALALNTGLWREALAVEPVLRAPAPGVGIVQPMQIRNARILSLLLILETLRRAPAAIDGPKV